MEYFCGVLDLLGTKSQSYDCHFSVDSNNFNNIVSVIPLTAAAKDKLLHELSYNTYQYINSYHNWFYGFSENNCAVAFLQTTPMRPTRITYPGIDLHAHHFATPVIVSATDHTITDVSTFDVIEFYGGVVDAVHNRAMAKEFDCNNGIRYTNPDIYTKKYKSVEINGDNSDNSEKFDIVASIVVPRSETLEIPDIKNEIHSILRFEFETPQPLDKLGQFYNYAMKLFQFCTGRLNVRADIRLYKALDKARFSKPIIVDYKDGYFDYANLDPHSVISLNSLSGFGAVSGSEAVSVSEVAAVSGAECESKSESKSKSEPESGSKSVSDDKFISLFKLLNSKKQAPYMEFLPQANKYVNTVLHTSVTDLCVAFEREYGLHKFPKDDECVVAAEKLTDDILALIDKQRESIPEAVINKAKSLLSSQLKAFSPSLREKITTLYNKYSSDMKKITEPEGHDILGITKFYSKDEFEKLIGKFIDIRNKASHAGIIWNGGEKIFNHLTLLIYFSILDRAGFTLNESGAILSYLFIF